ncbi:hypothetical protein B4U79_11420 [Dinothrombium tinctorium]|uniref:SAM domain-containing protein n=1 Tax=Dinothrombium tinctorium TaxID=1965070 RepID=A0A3S3Q9C6_9ACAR|nr:hypothetical protein B4U79_00729 [Dinothrombium tinctorium]RWS16215.1 hypothetical protein B4U79_11420 [Dinothrombium tinctorium]
MSVAPSTRSCHSLQPDVCFTSDVHIAQNLPSRRCDVLGPNEFYENNPMVLNSHLYERSVSNPMLSSQQAVKAVSCNQSNFQMDTISEMHPQLPHAITGLEDEVDSLHLKDVCNKWFTRDMKSGGRPMPLIGKSCSHQSQQVSHNLTPTLHDKVMPKETIVKTFDICSKQRSNYPVKASFVKQQHVSDTQQKSTDQMGPSGNQVEERHVVVVNCYDNRECSLKVHSQQHQDAMVESSNKENIANEMSIKQIPERVASASSQDITYKSSSESGRGTMSSDVQSAAKCDAGANTLDNSSLDSDQSNVVHLGSASNWDGDQTKSTTTHIIEHMQQELQRILDDGDHSKERMGVCRLPVVVESDSWVSDSTQSRTTYPSEKKTENEVRTDKQNLKGESGKSPASLVSGNQRNAVIKTEKTQMNRPVPKSRTSRTVGATNSAVANKANKYNVSNTKCKENLAKKANDILANTFGVDLVCDYPDDLTSEYTANTSNWDVDESIDTKKQLAGLEAMYSQILTLLNSRMKTAKKSMHCGARFRRRGCGSVSGRSSVASRSTHRDNYLYKNRYETRSSKQDELKSSSSRIKRLESHVVTLARSVAQLSSEIRSNHTLVQEVDKLRKDVDRIQEQFRALKTLTSVETVGSLKRGVKPETQNVCNGREMDKANKCDILTNTGNGRFEKLKRFFGDEPPILRQFLKKLGYEKYISKFDSEKIGINELIFMNEERLQKLGIPMGPRIRILQETNKLKTQNGNVYLV